MRGYPIIFGEGVDPDAYQYFLRAGIASGTQTPTAYDNAASFNGTSQFLQTASNVSIASGESFSFAGWFLATANPASSRGNLVSLSSGTQNIVFYFDTTNQLYVFRCNNSTGAINISSGLSSTIPLNTYVFVHAQYDAVLQKTAVSFNNGSFTYSTATGNPISGVSSPILLNGNSFFSASSFFPGSMSNWGFWKRALTASEVTQLWNNGAGRTYASLDSGLLTNLVSWWALNQNSVIADSHGTNTLTNNGTVTAPNIGPVVTGYGDSRRLISDFVKGIKSLGLWNSMVCWPLRRSQNANGTTAFSLGGLGTFNGTLVNAPTWGSNGATFLAASAQGISANVGNLILAEQALFGVTSSPTATTQSVLIARNSTGGTQNGMNLRANESSADISAIQQAGGSTVLSIAFANSTNFFGYASASNTTNARLKRFRSTESADTALAFTGNLTNTDPLWIGRRAAASGAGDCTIALASMFTSDIRSSWDRVYDLYRQTLGLGLGLP